jgi:hypothetical protein
VKNRFQSLSFKMKCNLHRYNLVLAEPKRTMKLLRAVARGAWVVTPEVGGYATSFRLV